MKLTLLQPVRHDGKRLQAGDVVDVKDERQARALLDCGAAEAVAPAGKRKAEAESDVAPASEAGE